MRAFITVPATVANLGPGFDILALALELQNEIRVEATPGAPLTIDPGPDAAEELRDPTRNLVASAYALACDALGVESGGVRLLCVNRIPFARGLGSSAAAALGGVLAAAAVHGASWGEAEILARVAGLEGHLDNTAAALLGGLAICAPGLDPVSMEVSDDLRAVLFIPETQLRTEEARRVVATSFSRQDAIFNASRCVLLVRALALRDYSLLGEAMDDRWHQPARSALMPALPMLIDAARAAGALGAALAGAGPSVIALVDEAPEQVAAAMRATAEGHGLPGTTLVSRIRNWGARVDVSG